MTTHKYIKNNGSLASTLAGIVFGRYKSSVRLLSLYPTSRAVCKTPNAVCSAHLNSPQKIPLNETVLPVSLGHQAYFVASINSITGKRLRNKQVPQVCLWGHKSVMALVNNSLHPPRSDVPSGIRASTSHVGVPLLTPSGIHLPEPHILNQNRCCALRNRSLRECRIPPCFVAWVPLS